jgi:hypothetical protein
MTCVTVLPGRPTVPLLPTRSHTFERLSTELESSR